jgi:hypothetical protein
VSSWPEEILEKAEDFYDRNFNTSHQYLKNRSFEEMIKSEESDPEHDRITGIEISDKIFQIDRASLEVKTNAKKRLQNVIEKIPLLNKDLGIMAEILSGMEGKENVLLEGGAEIEAERLLQMLADITKKKLTTIYFYKGMHTSDILGGLKPIRKNRRFKIKRKTKKDKGPRRKSDVTEIKWLDGPLTSAIRRGDLILLKGLEAASAEIIEKLNMLTDEARAITLPPEADEHTPLELKDDSIIFCIKYYRRTHSKPTISRAFRNRFCAINIYPDYNIDDLKRIVDFFLEHNLADGYGGLSTRMGLFHLELQNRARKRQIGSDRIEPYQFGYLNFCRWIEALNREIYRHQNITDPESEINKLFSSTLIKYLTRKILTPPRRPKFVEDAKEVQDEKKEELQKRKNQKFLMFFLSLWYAAEEAYIDEVSSPKDREQSAELFIKIFSLIEIPPEWKLVSFLTGEKENEKKLQKKRINIQIQKIWWDPEKHFRPPWTGKAKKKVTGPKEIKKGFEINTPHTGGDIKEGPDAWYGRDTFGNKGRGPVGGGGGAWGYRTEELYQNFLKKRKQLWDYDLGISLEDFNNAFGPEIERISIDFDKLFEPDMEIHKRNFQTGYKIDANRYMKFISGKGDDKIFDHTHIHSEYDKLKGVELVFALNKGRRIFNFNYALATLVSVMSAVKILKNHQIPHMVFGYSDKTNNKKQIDLETFIPMETYNGPESDKQLFQGLCNDWMGDTVEENPILESASENFSFDADTPIIVIVSDFRGSRAKKTIEKELNSPDVQGILEKVNDLKKRNYVVLGVQVGNHALAEYLFDEYIEINEDNYPNMPSLMATKITEVIVKYKKGNNKS